MRNIFIRSCALVLCAVLTMCTLCSCDLLSAISGDEKPDSNIQNTPTIDSLDLVSTKTAPAPNIPVYSGESTLKVATKGAALNYSPLFADGELTAADLCHVRLIDVDRSGRVVYSGIEGQSREYSSTDYTYYGISDITVKKNEDATVTYDIKLREDAFFSDGINITADDVIFTMYVLLDNTYDGYSKLGELDISGIDAYREGMSPLGEIIYNAAETGNTSFSDRDKQRFYEMLGVAQQTYTNELLGYVSREFYDEQSRSLYGGKWAADLASSSRFNVAYAMVVLGYGTWEKDASGQYTGVLISNDGVRYEPDSKLPARDDLFALSIAESGGILGLAEKAGAVDFNLALRDAFGSSYEYFFELMYESGKSAREISGIKKTGMYSLSVTLDSYHPTDIYEFSFYIAPLHVYGSRDDYKYTESRFGFTKGDLRELRNNKSTVSSGAYVYKSEKDGTLVFERNKLYYLGCPYISYVELVRCSDTTDIAHDIAEGKYDIASWDLDSSLISSIGALNSSGELDGDVVSMTVQSNGQYAYIGLNPELMKIGNDSSSEHSIALRYAFCTLLSRYYPASVQGHFGDTVQLVTYPLDRDVYFGVERVQLYSKDPKGEDIYTEGMTEAEKNNAAIGAALAYFEQAGYKLDRRGKKVESAPDGASMKFDFCLCTDTEAGASVLNALRDTSNALSKIGITLNIIEIDSTDKLVAALKEGECAMWAYGYELCREPELYLRYHTDGIPSSADDTGENYIRYSDKSVDALINELYKTTEDNDRKDKYIECFGSVHKLGIEIPLFVGNRAFMYTSQRMSKDSELSDMTRYYSWSDIVYQLKLK